MRKPFIKSKRVRPPVDVISTAGGNGAGSDGDGIREQPAMIQKTEAKIDDYGQSSIYDYHALLEAILKVNSINYAGNMMLNWGSIKL